MSTNFSQRYSSSSTCYHPFNHSLFIQEEEYDSDPDERYDTIQNEFDSMEDRYENTRSLYQRDYNTKMLLPIKTKQGLELRFAEVVDTGADRDAEETETVTDEPKIENGWFKERL